MAAIPHATFDISANRSSRERWIKISLKQTSLGTANALFRFLNCLKIPQTEDAKYLGLHFHRKLNERKYIFSKRKQLGIQSSKIYWLLGSKSQLWIENKLLLYKAILKPIWACGIQLWHISKIEILQRFQNKYLKITTACNNSNVEIIQRFQNKYLGIIVNAPWYVTNDTLHHDLNVPYVKDEIKRLS